MTGLAAGAIVADGDAVLFDNGGFHVAAGVRDPAGIIAGGGDFVVFVAAFCIKAKAASALCLTRKSGALVRVESAGKFAMYVFPGR